MARTLTEQQELFCREYLVDFDVQAAYKRAGYALKTNSNAYRLFGRPHIRDRIKELAAEIGCAAIDEALFRSGQRAEGAQSMPLEEAVEVRRQGRTDISLQKKLDAALITLERAQVEIACAALVDRTGIFDEDGRIMHPKDWPPELRACLDGVKMTRDDGYEFTMVKKIEALKLLGQSLNMFSEHEQNRKPEIVIQMDQDDLRC